MNLKEIKQRIQSVKNTQKITSAMKMVSAAKLRRAQAAIENMRPYECKLSSMLSALLSVTDDVKTLYTRDSELRRVAIVVVSSHSNMCGAFNANIIRAAKEAIKEYNAAGVEVELFPVGKKIADAFRKTGYGNCNNALVEQAGAVDYSVVSPIAKQLMERFATGQLDRVELLYTHFYNSAKQVPSKECFLPINLDNYAGGNRAVREYILEPGKRELVDALLPKVIKMALFTALLDSAAAEHSARMIAMQIATDNAGDLIQELVLEYNKGRQQAITNELLDIASGRG